MFFSFIKIKPDCSICSVEWKKKNQKKVLANFGWIAAKHDMQKRKQRNVGYKHEEETIQ